MMILVYTCYGRKDAEGRKQELVSVNVIYYHSQWNAHWEWLTCQLMPSTYGNKKHWQLVQDIITI